MAHTTVEDKTFGKMIWDSFTGTWGVPVSVPYFADSGSALRPLSEDIDQDKPAPDETTVEKSIASLLEKAPLDKRELLRGSTKRMLESIADERENPLVNPEKLFFKERKFKLTVRPAGQKPNPVSEAQHAAWAKLIEDGGAHFDAILRRGLEAYQEQRPIRVQWWKRIFGPDNKDLLLVLPEIDSVAEFKKFVRPQEFRIHTERDGAFPIGIHFDACFDRGNGFGVLVRDGEVLAMGDKDVALKLPAPEDVRIDHPVFGPLSSFCGEWHGIMRLVPFSAFRNIIGNRLTFERMKLADLPGTAPAWNFINSDFELVINANGGEKPTPAQIDAYREFISNPQHVCDLVLTGIGAYYLRVFDEYRESFGSDVDEADMLMPKIDSLDGLHELITLQTVSIFADEGEEHVPIGLSFSCSWEEEHGLAVRWRDGRIEEVGVWDEVF